MSSGNQRPLSDLRILDLTIALAGPYASLLLAGMGATVIKIEQPGKGDVSRENPPFLGSKGISFKKQSDDDVAIPFLNRGRNKQSITLNLKSERGKQLLMELAAKCDIVVENFSAGTVQRLGIGYEQIKAVNPSVIYCSISGFGQDGPYRNLKAMDTIIQGMSGLMGCTGFADGPPIRVGAPIADLVAPLYGVIGILAALHQRELTGIGQQIDIGMLDSMATIVASEHFDAIAHCGFPTRTGNVLARMAPFGVFQAKDGYVAICAHTDEYCRAVFVAMERPELMQDARFAVKSTRIVHSPDLNQIVEDWTRTLMVAEVIGRLSAHQVPCSLVNQPEASLVDPHVVYRKAVVPLLHPTLDDPEQALGAGMPIKFSESSCDYDAAAPLLGQHNDEVYQQLLGLTAEEILALKSGGII